MWIEKIDPPARYVNFAGDFTESETSANRHVDGRPSLCSGIRFRCRFPSVAVWKREAVLFQQALLVGPIYEALKFAGEFLNLIPGRTGNDSPSRMRVHPLITVEAFAIVIWAKYRASGVVSHRHFQCVRELGGTLCIASCALWWATAA